jgi:phosphoglycerate dehydrogenase-like enzyme
MIPHVAVLDTGYDEFDQEAAILGAAGYALRIFPGDRHDRAGKIAFAGEAEGILLRWTKVDDGFLEALPDARAIVRYGVGYDNIDVDACSRRGVLVSNVQGYANHSVSDHALALILACARNLREGMRRLRESYGAPPRAENYDLHQRTLGIVGLGNIGGALCVKARPLFGRVLAADPYLASERFAQLGAERVELDALLAQSDVISLHCSLTEETRNLVNDRAFARMARKPILVNTARGEVVETAALARALREGRIHSAGVDVFPDEPPGSDWDELLAHPNVVATGHYAWHSVGAGRELQRRAAENLLAMLRGQTPPDCLNPVLPAPRRREHPS